MSLFSALGTSVSGLTAQSAAFGNISDNVANSQTVGYKEVDTSFIDYLTTSTSQQNDPGAVATRPDYTNSVQGTISQSSDPLALAITGNGFFAVSESNGVASGTNDPTFDSQTYYTRAGDFHLDKNGYLVNSAGEYLQGWAVNPSTGAANQSSLAPIQIAQTRSNPVATSQISVSANLPVSTAGGSSVGPQTVDIYDSLGNQHTISLNWTPQGGNAWSLTVGSPDVSGGPIGSATVQFGTNGAAAGTIGSFSGATGLTPSPASTNGPASLTFTANFGSGPQTITLGLGHYGQQDGLTQFAGDTANPRFTTDGVPAGNFTGITMTNTGGVMANYDNGQSQLVAQVPVITFANADALQRQNGQAFTTSLQSGAAVAQAAGANGAGSLVTGSVESSNVDIASEFSKLIVAQEAYGANAKMITTADAMLQVTLNMKT
ncbi:MAG: flagellar hook protein FlgE [Acetobacteraceae bacterium]|nr:flagellar hook protein FlgE [Acetobacteraceae bacterium]